MERHVIEVDRSHFKIKEVLIKASTVAQIVVAGAIFSDVYVNLLKMLIALCRMFLICISYIIIVIAIELNSYYVRYSVGENYSFSLQFLSIEVNFHWSHRLNYSMTNTKFSACKMQLR